MPSPKPGNIKQPQSRLTNRRSFGSTDSNYSSYDLDSVVETIDSKSDRKNKAIPNNDSQDIGSDYQQNSNHNNNNNNNNDNNVDSPKTWWSKINPSLTLENKASVARDHLANERTFLAWLRTSLSFISIGIAITQLFRLTKISDDQRANEYNKEGKVLGIIFILLGVVFLSFGITRYFHSQYLMTKGHFPASRGSILIERNLDRNERWNTDDLHNFGADLRLIR
ncbi:hypothetical protein RhiirA1_21873 [Rhizophagus irregularis]|uniref:DUF202 domain-containing protein n=1 Tax=Rhizophagus irregularis TaxID=588596 RepID=A0A2N0RAK6_9GLOM|nr:hypothetical protein RhiirA1_21873 [Rhizophagus irregularis]